MSQKSKKMNNKNDEIIETKLIFNSVITRFSKLCNQCFVNSVGRYRLINFVL